MSAQAPPGPAPAGAAPQAQAPQPPQDAGGGRGARQGGGGGRGPNYPQQRRPLADPAIIARGEVLYRINCSACHGPDLRGGEQGGPNLLRSQVVLTDQAGENILEVVRSGRQNPGLPVMPPLPLPEPDVLAIAEYIHSVMAQLGRQGRPPDADRSAELDVLVGDPAAGQAYFSRACSSCHSVTGDLAGIASRVPDARALQNLWVSGGGGRGGGDPGGRVTTVTVTPRNGAAVTGRLLRIDEFVVTLVRDDGTRRTFTREGGEPRVAIHDPLEPHRKLALDLAERDMHNMTAYLATLK
jgi:cytochrome c oxidase cbb3-type subunit 3